MNLKMLQAATVVTAVHWLCLFYDFHLSIRRSPVNTTTLIYCRFTLYLQSILISLFLRSLAIPSAC